MDSSIIFVGLEDDEIIDGGDGDALYNGYIYARKRTAYMKRAKDKCTHTKKKWLELCEKYDFRCCKCGCEVLGGVPTKDHIIPITVGGTDSIKNIQPLCRGHNVSKSQKTRDYR